MELFQSSSLESHREPLWSEHDAAINDVQRLIMEQMQFWEALQHLTQRDLHLKTCQWCANTEMNAVAKGEVMVRLASNIKPLRVGKLAFIVIV